MTPRRRAFVACSSLLLGGAHALAACADDPVTPGPKSNIGAIPFDGAVPEAAPAVDAGAEAGEAGGDPTINDCTVYVDRTDPNASRNIAWDIVVNNLPEHCMKIKLGQVVTLVTPGTTAAADFAEHPVAVVKEPEKSTGPDVETATGKLTLPAASAYQVNCLVHPQMKVVIIVVP